MSTSKILDQVIISDTNRTPIVQIITWMCLVIGILSFVTHASIKIYMFCALQVESWFVLISLVFCIAQSIAVIFQCGHGYGTPLATLSRGAVQSILKSEYAATILLFSSLGFSKLAIGAFIHNLTPSIVHQRINYAIGTVVCLWMLCAVMIAAFQCDVPQTWDRTQSGRCIDRFTWWNVISILNIVTEVAIVALELGITARLHVGRRRKAVVMTIFACRLLVMIGASVQLAFFHQESKDPARKDDITLGYWRSTILNQIVQCLALVTTCLPYTNIFMEGFESGLLGLDDLRRRGEHTTTDKNSRSRSYQMMDFSRSGGKRSKKAPFINVTNSWAVKTEPVTSFSSSTKNLRSDRVATTAAVHSAQDAWME